MLVARAMDKPEVGSCGGGTPLAIGVREPQSAKLM